MECFTTTPDPLYYIFYIVWSFWKAMLYEQFSSDSCHQAVEIMALF